MITRIISSNEVFSHAKPILFFALPDDYKSSDCLEFIQCNGRYYAKPNKELEDLLGKFMMLYNDNDNEWQYLDDQSAFENDKQVVPTNSFATYPKLRVA